ncbi:MAG: DUF2088 domain-containing protein [Bacillaceae bacterium]|nr:DUF2088 domain-containing protein [Bacillaceae bacterium]
MRIIEQILKPVPIPKMATVQQNFNTPDIENIPESVRKTVNQSEVLTRIREGDRVAIAVGSRGIADLPVIVREVVRLIKEAKGIAFIVPAMGSHGGATAEGQINVLKQLGITESAVEAPIKASMEVIKIGELPNGLPIYSDKIASEADHIVVVNRIKPHTAFRGKVESGLMKMITIGLGKQKGAESVHQFGFKYMAEFVPEIAQVLIKKIPLLFGLAIIENAYDRPAIIEAIPADRIEKREPELLKEAKSLMPRIFFDDIDVLVVDEIGKDISGDGMDPNITGRYGTPYASGGPDVTRIVVLGLTKKTHGNVNGIGLADVTTQEVFDQIDFESGYANALTSTVVSMVKIPMIMPTRELAVKAAIKTCNAYDLSRVKMVRIKNTLDLKQIQISESLFHTVEGDTRFTIINKPAKMVL